MSRSYRVRVRESLRTTIRGEDHVGTTIELLEILPGEEMAALLRDELARRGFGDEEGRLVRKSGGLTIEVDPCSGEVEVRSECDEEITLEGEMSGHADTDWGETGRKRTEDNLRRQLTEQLQDRAEKQNARANKKATEQLESELSGLRAELDQVVNRVTAEALKRKAARLGRIKEMTEDAEAGSLTIVLEV